MASYSGRMRQPAPTTQADLRSPLRILALLAQAQHGLSIEELMHGSASRAATVRAALRALEAEGFVMPDGSGARYVLGARLMRLADEGRGRFLL